MPESSDATSRPCAESSTNRASDPHLRTTPTTGHGNDPRASSLPTSTSLLGKCARDSPAPASSGRLGRRAIPEAEPSSSTTSVSSAVRHEPRAAPTEDSRPHPHKKLKSTGPRTKSRSPDAPAPSTASPCSYVTPGSSLFSSIARSDSPLSWPLTSTPSTSFKVSPDASSTTI